MEKILFILTFCCFTVYFFGFFFSNQIILKICNGNWYLPKLSRTKLSRLKYRESKLSRFRESKIAMKKVLKYREPKLSSLNYREFKISHLKKKLNFPIPQTPKLNPPIQTHNPPPTNPPTHNPQPTIPVPNPKLIKTFLIRDIVDIDKLDPR